MKYWLVGRLMPAEVWLLDILIDICAVLPRLLTLAVFITNIINK